MMWKIQGKPVDPKRFLPFEPLRIFNDYDGPRIFTFLDDDQALCLACWSDEDESISRFLVVPVNEQIIMDLESGLLSVREALTQTRLWAVDWSQERSIHGAWLVKPEDVPEDAQPRNGTMLYRSHEPIHRLRTSGELIRTGEVFGGGVIQNMGE